MDSKRVETELHLEGKDLTEEKEDMRQRLQHVQVFAKYPLYKVTRKEG